jgi:hypothetical protein
MIDFAVKSSSATLENQRLPAGSTISKPCTSQPGRIVLTKGAADRAAETDALRGP